MGCACSKKSLKNVKHLSTVPTPLIRTAASSRTCRKALAQHNGSYNELYTNNQSLFTNLLTAGLPVADRWEAWKAAVHYEDKQETYQYLLNSNTISEFESLIEKDIKRTFPSVEFFDNEERQQGLKRVLLAFANNYPEIGYCQGMNFVAGVLLLVADGDEGETFGVLERVITKFGACGLYIAGFPLLDSFSGIFHRTLLSLDRELEEHLVALDVSDHIWVFKWWFTFYANIFTIQDSVRIFDCIFACGLKFIVNFAISLSSVFRKELMSDDSDSIFLFLSGLREPKVKIDEVLKRSKGIILLEENSNEEDCERLSIDSISVFVVESSGTDIQVQDEKTVNS